MFQGRANSYLALSSQGMQWVTSQKSFFFPFIERIGSVPVFMIDILTCRNAQLNIDVGGEKS